MALKEIHNNPTAYGFYLREKDLYPNIPYREVEVDTTITNLVAFADKMDINYKTLKEFNPWLRGDNLPNSSRRKYLIKIPEKEYLSYDKLSKQIKHNHNIYRDTTRIDEIR